MCPMRILLVFFSAVLAGFFAWRTYRSESEEEGWGELVMDKQKSGNGEQEFGFREVLEKGFWVFVDMASGRYLCRNLREMKNFQRAKGC